MKIEESDKRKIWKFSWIIKIMSEMDEWSLCLEHNCLSGSGVWVFPLFDSKEENSAKYPAKSWGLPQINLGCRGRRSGMGGFLLFYISLFLFYSNLRLIWLSFYCTCLLYAFFLKGKQTIISFLVYSSVGKISHKNACSSTSSTKRPLSWV